MNPYYVSDDKVAFLLAPSGTARGRSEETTISSTGTLGALPSIEGGVQHKKSESAAVLESSAEIIGHLEAAARLVRSQVVDLGDPTLSYEDWIELDDRASTFCVLRRDSHDGKGEIAFWFSEIGLSHLGLGCWIVLTGTPDHLSERWSGARTRNRSGSGTEAVFDIFRAISRNREVKSSISPKEFFAQTSGMRGMAGANHRINSIAVVRHVVGLPNSGYLTSTEGGSLPVARVVVASPLFVERARQKQQTTPSDTPSAEAQPPAHRAASWLGFITDPARRTR